MKKILALFVIITLLISGCSLFKKDPREAANKSISEFADVDKMNFSLKVNGVVKAPAGEVPAKTQLAVDFSGKSDSSKEGEIKGDMVLKLDFNIDDKKGNGTIAFKVIDKKLFFSVNKLELPGVSMDSFKSQLDSLLNVWWAMPVSEENSIGKLTQEQKEMKDKFKTTQFFTNAYEDGEEDVNGVKTVKYRVDVDKAAVKKFLTDVTLLSGNQPNPEDESAIEAGLKEIEFSGAVWVGKDDDVLHRIKGTLVMQPKEGPISSFDLDYTGFAYGEDVDVVAPENPKDFNPLVILPLITALSSVSADAAPVTPGPVDDKPLGSKQVK